uniref:ATP-dependent metalloprotease n=1 Tax=Streptosarcina moshanensis TaxID=3096259 RepID=A0AAU7LJS0_9VIRI
MSTIQPNLPQLKDTNRLKERLPRESGVYDALPQEDEIVLLEDKTSANRSAQLNAEKGSCVCLDLGCKANHNTHTRLPHRSQALRKDGLVSRTSLFMSLSEDWQKDHKSTLNLALPVSLPRACVLMLTSVYLRLLPVQAWMSGAQAFWVSYLVLIDARWSLLKGFLEAQRHRYDLRRAARMIDKLALSDSLSLSYHKSRVPIGGALYWIPLPGWCLWPLMKTLCLLKRSNSSWKRALWRVPRPIVGPAVPVVHRLQLALAIGLIPVVEQLPNSSATLIKGLLFRLWECVPFFHSLASFLNRIAKKPIRSWTDSTSRSHVMYFRHMYFRQRWMVPWARVWTSHLGQVAGHQELVYELHKAALVYRGGAMLASPPSNSGVFRMMRSLATRYLLIGPAGSGKKLLAHAMAADSRVPLLRLSCEALLTGDPILPARSSEKFFAVFGLARALSPCVVLVEEVDQCSRLSQGASGEQKGGGGASSGDTTSNRLSLPVIDVSPSQLLVLLLREVTALKWSGVFLVATTSLPNKMDRALLRKRRFTRVFFLDLPTWFEREDVFQSLLRTRGIARFQHGALHTIAKLTAGFTCAELGKLANEVLLSCIRLQTKEVSTYQVQMAFYKMTRGALKCRPEERSPARNTEALFYKVGESIVQPGHVLGDRSSVLYIPPDPLRARFEYLQRTFWETPSFFTQKSDIVTKIAKSLAGIAAKDLWLACLNQASPWEDLTRTLERQKDADLPQAYNLLQTVNEKWPSSASVVTHVLPVHYGTRMLETDQAIPIQPDQDSLEDYLTHSVLRRSAACYRLEFSLDPVFGILPKEREQWALEDGLFDWFVLDPGFRRTRLTDDEDALQWLESSRERQRNLQTKRDVSIQAEQGQGADSFSLEEPIDPELFESAGAWHVGFEHAGRSTTRPHSHVIHDADAAVTPINTSHFSGAINDELKDRRDLTLFPSIEQIRAWAPLFEWETVRSGAKPPSRKRMDESCQWLLSLESYYTGTSRANSSETTDTGLQDLTIKRRMLRKRSPSIRSVLLEGRMRLWEEVSTRELRGVDFFLRMTRLVDTSTHNLDHFPIIASSHEWDMCYDGAWADSNRYGMAQDVYGWDATELQRQSTRLDHMAQELILPRRQAFVL